MEVGGSQFKRQQVSPNGANAESLLSERTKSNAPVKAALESSLVTSTVENSYKMLAENLVKKIHVVNTPIV